MKDVAFTQRAHLASVTLASLLVGTACSPSPTPSPTSNPRLGQTSAAWTKVGSLKQGREDPVAWVLNDHEVLVTGGDTGPDKNEKGDTEIFDINTGESTRLDTGGMFITGQTTSNLGFRTDTHLFAFMDNTKTLNTFALADSGWKKQTLSLDVAGVGLRIAAIPSSRNHFAICGGIAACSQLDASSTDPSKWTIKPMGSLSSARSYLMLEPFGDSVVAVGGIVSDGTFSTAAERWNGTSWDRLPDMPRVRARAVAMEIKGGRFVVMGGYTSPGDGGGNFSWTALIYDSDSKRWRTGSGRAVSARRQGTLVKYSDTQLAWVGGDITPNTGSNDLDIFNTTTLTFETPQKLGTLRYQAATVAMPDGRIVLLGGSLGASSTSYVMDVEVYNPTGTPPTVDPSTSIGVDPTGKLTTGGNAIACTLDSQCTSGHCADGVCCDTACKDTCHSCALPKFPGVCTLEPAGVDLRAECGLAGSCIGTCGPTGACVSATTGSICRLSACTSRTQGTGPGSCSASKGACGPSVAFDCAPYTCDPVLKACKGKCVTSEDCAAGSLCDIGKGLCGPAPTSSDDSGCAVSSPGDASQNKLPMASIFGGILILGLAGRLRARRNQSAFRRSAFRRTPD